MEAKTTTPAFPSDLLSTEITHLVWRQAILVLRNLSAMDNYQLMTGPEALTEAANAMELAMKEPWVKNG